MRFALLLALPLFTACGSRSKCGDGTTETGVGGCAVTYETGTVDDTDDTDPADTDVAGACAAMTSGEDWAWDGECPMMLTPCEIEVTECSLTIGYSSGMTMGMPDGGTISGSTVTFTGGTVEGCTGEILDANTIEGSCADGCTFTLTFGG